MGYVAAVSAEFQETWGNAFVVVVIALFLNLQYNRWYLTGHHWGRIVRAPNVTFCT